MVNRPSSARALRKPAGLRLALLWLASLLSLAIFPGCEQAAGPLEKGLPPPAFSLPTLTGSTAHFPVDYHGQTVAIRFWADWCPFCESEMRELEPVYEKYRERGLRIIAVNVRQEQARVKRFTERLGISYQTLLDRDGQVARDYGVSALPMTFFVDRQGLLRGRILGEATPEVFERLLLEMMGGR